MTNHNEKGKPMFISAARYYDRNLKDAQNLKAQPALIEAPDCEQEAGVIIWGRKDIRGLMPTAEALRLALEIVAALDAHKAKA
ncbi:hypothetical protein [Arthrobacter sp. 754]|uniref:hypothetical protein n=1 Tax=Arthrobacter sp. 754 TaxID=3156315 RepID=UPI0033976EEA